MKIIFTKYLAVVGILLFFLSCSNNTSFVPQDIPREVGTVETVIIGITSQENCFLFDDFTQTPENRWGIVNDGVMGGKSLGYGDVQNDILVFSGTIITRGGGFSSLRGNLESGILSDYNSVKLRAKSDGREYRITFRDTNNSRISHQAIIPFQNSGEFEEVTIGFNDLETTFFGRKVASDPFEKQSAREIGMILSDGVDGEFRLEIDELSFCK